MTTYEMSDLRHQSNGSEPLVYACRPGAAGILNRFKGEVQTRRILPHDDRSIAEVEKVMGIDSPNADIPSLYN